MEQESILAGPTSCADAAETAAAVAGTAAAGTAVVAAFAEMLFCFSCFYFSRHRNQIAADSAADADAAADSDTAADDAADTVDDGPSLSKGRIQAEGSLRKAPYRNTDGNFDGQALVVVVASPILEDWCPTFPALVVPEAVAEEAVEAEVVTKEVVVVKEEAVVGVVEPLRPILSQNAMMTIVAPQQQKELRRQHPHPGHQVHFHRHRGHPQHFHHCWRPHQPRSW